MIVHGVEYGFGAHEQPTTGIFEVEPKHCPGFTFRKSILIGRTDLGPKEVRIFMEKLAEQYSGNTYHLITKNCNHFCNDVCLKLTGKPIPRWVNRLARLGFLCKCVLPAGLNETKVRHVRSTENQVNAVDKKKLRSQSSRFASSSTNPPPNIRSSRSLRSLGKSSRQRLSISPSSLSDGTANTTLTVKV
ncbi:deSI-like protein At4g17486 isoform X2 [Punica granatum]|uniref:DeSI-like protein At4g17486 isoform X2 n=1 Tax=Punica granatum TaxID=22663 RepID=A0A6P8BVJ7_PUNGR|nr:deSI-like protein At4g17486 isoform X2 [Punica granatum]